MDFKGLIKSAADKTVEMAKNEIEKAQTQKQIIAEQRMQVKVGFRITAGAALVHSPLVSNMYQRSDGTIYFNQNIDDSFTLLEYIWNGPHFQKNNKFYRKYQRNGAIQRKPRRHGCRCCNGRCRWRNRRCYGRHSNRFRW